MSECQHQTFRIAIRSRELKDVWGTSQVLECVKCGKRWCE